MKGFIYTVMSMAMITIAFIVLYLTSTIQPYSSHAQDLRVNEMYYLLRSIDDDFKRAAFISGRRALIEITNYALNNSLNNSKDLFYELMMNGTIFGNSSSIMENSTLKDWINKMEQLSSKSGFYSYMNIPSIKANSSNVISIGSTVFYNISDKTQSFSIENYRPYSLNISFDGAEDVFLSKHTYGEYTNTYHFCNEPQAFKIGSAEDSNYSSSDLWTSGYSYVASKNDNLSGVLRDYIVFIDDLCNYPDLEELSEFKAVVSYSSVDLNAPCGTSIHFNILLSGFSGNVSNNTLVVLNKNDVWQNNILLHLTQKCYFLDNDAPSLFDRLENKSFNHIDTGIASFLYIPYLPLDLQKNATAIDYLYFNGSYPIYRIKGVSEYKKWFYLDEKHIDEWGIKDLKY